MPILPTPTAPIWDIFCRVIDNYGDAGVTWRLCTQLAQRGVEVRLWIDDSSSLRWMAPAGHAGVSVWPWEASCKPEVVQGLPRATVWVEAFGCEIAPEFIATNPIGTCGNRQKNSMEAPRWPVWINLEYLSAEDWVQRCHGLASPVLHGPAQGATKHFFYPGFHAHTGGLLREPGLAARQRAFDRAAWLHSQGIAWQGEPLVSLFCYEPALLADWLELLASDGHTRLLITPGRANAAVRQCLASNAPLSAALQPRLHYLPWLEQPAFDELLWACDFNAVRGEDSLVRALWAGKPFVWHIYPQDDGVHHEKLEAFLQWLRPDPAWGELYRAWNADAPQAALQRPLLASAWPQYNAWLPTAQGARTRLMQAPDLCSQLLDFVAGKQ